MANVSVIVPVTQNANHIDELLSVLLVQSESDIEVICPVVNDSEYLQLLDNYTIFDSRIKVLRLENERQWLAASVKAATADFVVFLKPSSVVAMAFIQHLFELASGQDDVDFVYTPMSHKDELFSQVHSLSAISIEDFSSKTTDGYFYPNTMSKTFLQKADKHIFGKLIRRDFLQKMISEQIFMSEETVLFYNCLFKARNVAYTLKDLIYEWHYSDPFVPQSYKIDKEDIKISVIMPVYNAEKNLARCLDSLVLQTYKNLEFICVNDGSTDGSAEILKQYAAKDKRFKIIMQENKGVSATRNRALQEVSGDYVSMIDADDFVSLALYQKFVAIVQQEERQIDLFQFNGMRFFEAYCNNPYWIYVLYYATDWGDFFNGHFLSFDAHVNMGDDIIWDKIYRTKWLREENINFAEGLIFEDRLFSLEAHLRAKNKYLLENYLYFYRQHSNSITHSLGENVFDIFKILAKEENLLKEAGIYDENIYLFFEYNVLECWVMLLLVKRKYKESFLQVAREHLKKFFAQLDESICRRGTYMGIYDDLTTLSLEQIKIKYKDAPFLIDD